MKFSEMVDLFQSYVEDSDVDEIALANWFNEGQMQLVPFFAPKTSTTYSDTTTDIGYDLPVDCAKVLGADGEYTWNELGQIVFADGGDHTIYYTYTPPATSLFDGTNVNTTSYLPFQTHYLMVLWAGYRYWHRESEGDAEELNTAERFRQDFLMGIATLRNILDAQSNTKVDRWIVVP